MSLKNNKNIKTILGSLDVKDKPYDIFNKNIILLLDKISKEILKVINVKNFLIWLLLVFGAEQVILKKYIIIIVFLKTEWDVDLYYILHPQMFQQILHIQWFLVYYQVIII